MAYEDLLVFHAQGASEPQRNRGLAAAKEYFAAVNVDPWSAIEAIRKRDQWDLSGFDPDLEPSDEDARALNAWDQATEFAIAESRHWLTALRAFRRRELRHAMQARDEDARI